MAGVDGLYDPPVTNATVKQRTRAILVREGSPTVAAVDLVGHALHQWRVLKPASIAELELTRPHTYQRLPVEVRLSLTPSFPAEGNAAIEEAFARTDLALLVAAAVGADPSKSRLGGRTFRGAIFLRGRTPSSWPTLAIAGKGISLHSIRLQFLIRPGLKEVQSPGNCERNHTLLLSMPVFSEAPSLVVFLSAAPLFLVVFTKLLSNFLIFFALPTAIVFHVFLNKIFQLIVLEASVCLFCSSNASLYIFLSTVFYGFVSLTGYSSNKTDSRTYGGSFGDRLPACFGRTRP